MRFGLYIVKLDFSVNHPICMLKMLYSALEITHEHFEEY